MTQPVNPSNDDDDVVGAKKHSIWTKLYRGETSFDFVGLRRRWFMLSGTVIIIGLLALGIRGLNFSIDFKGGTVWEVPSTASVTHVRDVVGGVSADLRQSTIEVLTDRQTGHRTIRVKAEANATKDKTKVTNVTNALAKMGGVSVNEVTLTDVGASWGSDITNKAVRALIFFLIAVVIYITFRFTGKMAIAALVALLHDILVTAGIYALSGFQVSPATVIAFLTILGYSLYDTIVVFDKVEENEKGLGSTGRLTYSDTVNLSMNQVLMRSINTSFVAIMPILSILVIGSLALGASALQDFGLALFIGLLTGAYSSIFVASPLLAMLKEREPKYAQIREKLASRTDRPSGRLSPAMAAAGAGAGAAGQGQPGKPVGQPRTRPGKSATPAKATPATPAATPAIPATSKAPTETPDGVDDAELDEPTLAGSGARATAGAAPRPTARPAGAPRTGNRPPPRPRKKGRRR
jgi:preprotein translocase subunit SecF